MQLAFTSNFNPRSPHGERPRYSDYGTQYGLFQSTLPARGATQRGRCAWLGCDDFNPRSPHGERHRVRNFVRVHYLFQSTLPARGATGNRKGKITPKRISIHAPRTGSDASWLSAFAYSCISIHAPRTGSDFSRSARTCSFRYFNPRSPHGERLTSTPHFTVID